MQYDVIKPFTTATRRLIPGDGPAGTVDDSDDFSPNTKDVLLERKFIQPKSNLDSLRITSGVDMPRSADLNRTLEAADAARNAALAAAKVAIDSK